MTRLALAALLGALSLSACAQAPQAPGAATPGDKPAPAAPAPVAAAPKAGTPDARAQEAIARLDAQVKVDYVGAAPMPGFREVIAGGQLLYVSDDGRYLMQGTVLDLEDMKDVSRGSPALLKYRRELLATVPHADRIVFAPPNAKYTITVFTDIECGYCRKLHSEIGELNRLGIAVEYLAFPRMGLGSQDYKDMVSVWCASDRRRALTDAKGGKPVSPRDCKTPVNMQFDIGQRIGVSGTPAIYAADGSQLGGYLPPQALREALDQLEGEGAGGR